MQNIYTTPEGVPDLWSLPSFSDDCGVVELKFRLRIDGVRQLTSTCTCSTLDNINTIAQSICLHLHY